VHEKKNSKGDREKGGSFENRAGSGGEGGERLCLDKGGSVQTGDNISYWVMLPLKRTEGEEGREFFKKC